jgi:uncharacterized membrane protein YbhN (UPF0104 family)
MRKKVLTVLRYVVFLALGLLLAWLTYRQITPDKWAQIKVALTHARYALLIPIIVLYLASHYSRAVRWKIMIGPLGYKPVTLNVFFAVMIGYLVNMALPRLGEVARCTFLGRHEEIPIEQLLGTIIVERAFDMLCLLIVFGCAFFLQSNQILDFAHQHLGGGGKSSSVIWWVLAALVIGVGVCWVLYRKLPVVRKLVLGVWGGIVKVRFMKQKGWFLFHTVFIWTMYFVCTRLGLYSLRELDNLGIKETMSVLATGSIGMILAPGGLGAYPYFVDQTLLLYSVPDAMALAASNVLWIVPTVVIIIGGVISFVGLASKAKPSKDEELPALRT